MLSTTSMIGFWPRICVHTTEYTILFTNLLELGKEAPLPLMMLLIGNAQLVAIFRVPRRMISDQKVKERQFSDPQQACGLIFTQLHTSKTEKKTFNSCLHHQIKRTKNPNPKLISRKYHDYTLTNHLFLLDLPLIARHVVYSPRLPTRNAHGNS
jgi:hypothetical protein